MGVLSAGQHPARLAGPHPRNQRIDGSPPAHRDLDAYLDHLLAIHPIGPPERCTQRLSDTLAATGARRLLLMVEGSGHPQPTLDTITRLGTEVLPTLRHHHPHP
jgi:hypothetical protein